jgi:hypothetical protein
MVSITSALVSITSSMVSITSALVSITSALGNLSGARTAIRRATPCWMSNTLSSGLPSGARSLRREPPPIQRRYRSKRVRLGSPACIQQEGFCAPCGGVEAKTHNIAAVGGNGARCIKTRPATQQAGISGVQVFHSTGGRPAKGAECPSGVASLSDHHRAVGGDAISIAAIAAQRAQPSQRRFHGGWS